MLEFNIKENKLYFDKYILCSLSDINICISKLYYQIVNENTSLETLILLIKKLENYYSSIAFIFYTYLIGSTLYKFSDIINIYCKEFNINPIISNIYINQLEELDLNNIKFIKCIDDLDKNLTYKTLQIINENIDKFSNSDYNVIYRNYKLYLKYNNINNKIYSLLEIDKKLIEIFEYKNKILMNIGLQREMIKNIMNKNLLPSQIIKYCFYYYYNLKCIKPDTMIFSYFSHPPKFINFDIINSDILKTNKCNLQMMEICRNLVYGINLTKESILRLRTKFSKYILKNDYRSSWLNYLKTYKHIDNRKEVIYDSTIQRREAEKNESSNQ